MSDRPLVYTEFAPGAAARDIALTYWGFHVRALPHEGFVHRVWPDGCVSLTLVCVNGHGVGAHLLGVRQQVYEVPLAVGVRYWGVRFRPEAGAAFVGVAPSVLRDQSVVATTLLGDDVMRLAQRVAELDAAANSAQSLDAATLDAMRSELDAWIVERANERIHERTHDGPNQRAGERATIRDAIDPIVRTAAAAIVATQGQQSIAEIAQMVGVSARVLQRRFSQTVGLSPKAFAVLRRARSVLKRVVTDGTGPDVGGWSGLALSSGYADQAHFAREVARLTRFAPTALRERLDTIEHAQLED